jgi:hypothetical protein
MCLWFLFLLCVAPSPALFSVYHDQCIVSGASLTACPVVGGGTLTFNGANFVVGGMSTIQVWPPTLCQPSSLVIVNTSMLTCALSNATVNFNQTAGIWIGTNGGITSAIGITVQYGACYLLRFASFMC